jgi:ER membrane protein complex subunit 1
VVPRLAAVTCTPAVLESTALMVATGVDVFFNRLSPSRGYDMVPDDFPAALLVFMMGVMVVALWALRTMLTSKALKLKWQ